MNILFFPDTTVWVTWIKDPRNSLGVIAHGEYCEEEFYLKKHIDFTQNVVDLCNLVGGINGTWGGNQDECCEPILGKVDIIYVGRRVQ